MLVDITATAGLSWEDGILHGGEPMNSRRVIALGRYDPLPDEPAASIRRSAPRDWRSPDIGERRRFNAELLLLGYAR